MDLHEVYKNSGLGKWFHGESANKTPGWDRYNSEGKLVGECGDAKKGDSYSACLSKQKAERLGKKGIANFVKRKRAAQSKAGRGEKGSGGKGQKPINVDTGANKMDECVECNEELEIINEGKNKPNDPEKWSACKSAAKSKFDVYPSAYANAWASKCYKKKGGTWRSLKEEIKVSVKENIISSMLESKHAPRGPVHQRPKSWSKGTKSGSDKKKMRREGKDEAKDMNEEKKFARYAPRHSINIAFAQEYANAHGIDPKHVAERLNRHPDAPFPTIDDTMKAYTDVVHDMSDRYITTQEREGNDPEKAMRNWAENHLSSVELYKEKNQHRFDRMLPDDDDSYSGGGRGSVRMTDPNTGRRVSISGHNAYDAEKDGYMYEESLENKLRKRLEETSRWNPPETNEYGAEADDMMLAADEEARREEEMRDFHEKLKKKLRKS